MIGFIVLAVLWVTAILLLGGCVFWAMQMRDDRRELREFNRLLDEIFPSDGVPKW
jgi:UDP-N-acetylmuramyl pentapeptide phosphotransferase/UDP-N-acetylglucosamine-1-phosphate transferase